MAKWNTEKLHWPDLEKINGGEQLTIADPITQDLLNRIVNALIYLYFKEDTE